MRPTRPPIPDGEAASYQGALRALVDRRWIRSTGYRDQVRFMELETASAALQVFVPKLIRKAKRMSIPLLCESASYDVAFICHGVRRHELAPLEWAIIVHLGLEIATQYGLPVRWGGSLFPATWLSFLKAKRK